MSGRMFVNFLIMLEISKSSLKALGSDIFNQLTEKK